MEVPHPSTATLRFKLRLFPQHTMLGCDGGHHQNTLKWLGGRLSFEFFLNESLDSLNILVISIKRLEPAISYVKDQDTTTASARQK